MRKIHLEIDLETEEFQDAQMLEKIIKIVVEKVFFTQTTVTNVKAIELDIDDKSTPSKEHN